jgi:hypothetical protein
LLVLNNFEEENFSIFRDDCDSYTCSLTCLGKEATNLLKRFPGRQFRLAVLVDGEIMQQNVIVVATLALTELLVGKLVDLFLIASEYRHGRPAFKRAIRLVYHDPRIAPFPKRYTAQLPFDFPGAFGEV